MKIFTDEAPAADKRTEEELWEEHLIRVQKPIWDLIDRLTQPSPAAEWLMSPEVTETLKRFREEDERELHPETRPVKDDQPEGNEDV